MTFRVFFFNAHNNEQLKRVEELLILQNKKIDKIMATIQEIEQKVDELQVKLDAEQEQIKAALDALNVVIEDLKAQLTDGGTAADRQRVFDKVVALTNDLAETIPDAEPPTP